MKVNISLNNKFLKIDNIITYNYVFFPMSIFILVYILIIYTLRITSGSSDNLVFSVLGYVLILLMYGFIVKYWFGYVNQIKEDWSKSVTLNYKRVKKGYDVVNVDRFLSFQVLPYTEYKNKHMSKYSVGADNPLTIYNYVLIATELNTNKTILITRGSYRKCSKVFNTILDEYNANSRSSKDDKTIALINENSSLLEKNVIRKYRMNFLRVIFFVILLELLRVL
ncbi:hypothetical protein R2F61_01085 [Mollicutes bacterium LVI A0078]|nr:hypothetical protein RZE84_01085 [Mollicutes bacterium LVI A0075]WOO91172.1 hypothetical protein R2F61_01085 [Mollicutes bacterium LVI A0078]